MKTKAQIATMLSTFLALAATAEAGNIISGLGTYAVTEPTVVIYGNNTLNIGSAGSAAEQPTIYGYITTQQSAIVKGDTYLNIRGGHITQEANTYSNVYAGPNYGGIVEGAYTSTYPGAP